MTTIIIPAHNEAKVIQRCISALTMGSDLCDIEVMVVCNGCTDDTAKRARLCGECVQVIETDQPSKSHALNLGDQAARGFPRFYVDADVVLTEESLRLVVEVLQSGTALAAAPRAELDLSHSSWAVRAYYAIDFKLPWFREGIGNSGVYGLSEAGRARFGEFPDITTDDTFVRLHFRPDERATVADAVAIVTAPSTLRALIAIKTRSHFSKWEITAHFPSLAANAGARNAPVLVKLCFNPLNWPGLAVYAFVKIAARVRCRWMYRLNSRYRWERDETSRAAQKPGGRTAVLSAGPQDEL